MQLLKWRSNLVKLWLLATSCLMALGTGAVESAPIRLHPANSHYFEFRGKPVVLVGSTEHYSSLINLDFDYLRYLDEVEACGLNLVRVFSGSYRQFPGFVIEDSPLNVPPARFLAPWARSNVPGASDGTNKFDLTKWDASYFHRLHQFVDAASERGIVVEFTLFCPFYTMFSWANDDLWNISPMNARNHINGVGAGSATDCFAADSDLLPFQKALVRKCAEELNGYDNVIFEIANEPYFGVQPGWEALIIGELVAAEAALPQRHLIAQNIANNQQVVTTPHPAVSILNFHYAYPVAALANQGLNRVIGNDETGFEGTGDFIYRSEAWEFMLAGGGLEDHLDYSFTTTREDGLASPREQGGGGPAIRRQLGLLRWFLEELPLVRCAPETSFITGGVPAGGSVQVLGSAGEAYGIYLRGGTQADLVANLPSGTYRGRWLDPRSGEVTASLAEFTHAGGSRTLVSPVYGEDVALLLFGGTQPPPEVQLIEPAYQTVAAADSVITLKAQVSLVNGTLEGLEFLDGDKLLGTALAAPYHLTLSGLPKGNHVFRARALASDGRRALSPPVKCKLMSSYHAGVNFNGDAVTLNGQPWMSGAEAQAFGMVMGNFQNLTTSPSVRLYPQSDPLIRQLVSSQVLRMNQTNNLAMTVSYPVPNGTYDIFFCLVEGQTDFGRDVRVLLEGQIVAQGIGNLALGEWVNYGPYRTSVSDGSVDLSLSRETKGSPKIANFSIYQAAAPATLAEVELTIVMAPGMALLSWPVSVPAGNLESSIMLGATADWQPVALPAADFTDYQEIAVPTTGPQRFFRLRKD